MRTVAELREGFEAGQSLVLQGSSVHAAPSQALLSAKHEDQLILFASSGSTGRPKWVAHSRDSLLASARAVNAHLEARQGETWFLCLPVYHVGGFGLCLRAWEAKGRVVQLRERWSVEAFAQQLKAAQAQWLSLVPTQVHDLVRAQVRGCRSLRGVIVGGGQLRSELAQAARDLGWPILCSYGLSEAGSQVATELPGRESEGMILLPGWEVMPAQEEETQGARLRGEALALGYWLEEDGADGGGWRFQPLRDSQGWFQSADCLELEQTGKGQKRLRMRGRLDDRVKILGELVSLAALQGQLESFLREGEDAALRAQVDLRAEHQLVLETCGVGEQRAAEIQREFEHQSPAFVRISQQRAVEKISRTELGKVIRF